MQRQSLIASILGLLLGTMALAQDDLGRKFDPFAGLSEDNKQEFLDVAKELRCPTCTGLSVLESDATFSVQIKDIVKEQVQGGKSKDEILQYFTERYGPWILRAPPKQGFNLLAWALPIAILVMGPFAVWFWVWRRGDVLAPGVGVRSSDEIIQEMHTRLAHLRRTRGL